MGNSLESLLRVGTITGVRVGFPASVRMLRKVGLRDGGLNDSLLGPGRGTSVEDLLEDGLTLRGGDQGDHVLAAKNVLLR
jgi:hypothetical protein